MGPDIAVKWRLVGIRQDALSKIEAAIEIAGGSRKSSRHAERSAWPLLEPFYR
jgi:hypothetical protein